MRSFLNLSNDRCVPVIRAYAHCSPNVSCQATNSVKQVQASKVNLVLSTRMFYERQIRNPAWPRDSGSSFYNLKPSPSFGCWIPPSQLWSQHAPQTLETSEQIPNRHETDYHDPGRESTLFKIKNVICHTDMLRNFCWTISWTKPFRLFYFFRWTGCFGGQRT